MLHIVLNDPSKSDIVFSKMTPDAFRGVMSNIQILAIDLKTTGLDPMEDEIKAVTVATRDDEIYILTTEVIKSNFLMEVFSGKSFIVHSGSKDISFLMSHGVEIDRVFDTCLADQVCQCNINKTRLSYELPSVLDRYKIAHSFRFYERGAFWREGFSVGGCNYLSLYVRHLFELRDRIYETHPQSSNLFLMVNRLLLISSEMNTTPLKLDRNLFMDHVSDFLEDICSQEAQLMEVFTTIGDSPGPTNDHLFPPDGLDKIEPIYDVDDEEAVDSFVERCDYNPTIENAFECGMLDFFPSVVALDKYKNMIHLYNNVYVKLLNQKDENVFCHYTPITPKSLSIGCISNFPRPTLAKKNNIPITMSLTIHPYSIIRENIFNTAEFEMRAFEIEDLEIFGLAILAGDKNLMRLVKETSIEMNDLIRCLEAQKVEVPSKKSLTTFVKKLFKNGCASTNTMMNESSIPAEHRGAMMKVITDRYHFATDTISGIIKRMNQSGNAFIFSEYPLNWNNFTWSQAMKKLMDDPNFWEDYQVHQQTQDETFEKVQRYYEEQSALQRVVRDRVMDYSRLYVMSNVMYAFYQTIKEDNYSSVVRFTTCDKTSFVLSYPAILSPYVDEVESKTLASLNRRFGNDLPVISTII